MEEYKDIYRLICRVCLSFQNAKNMVCLVDEKSEDGLSCYGKSLLVFANISIQITDGLPNMMCCNCLLLLKQAIYLKFKCESTQEKLNRLTKKSVFCNESTTRNIIEYAMFGYYFSTKSPKSQSQRITDVKKEAVLSKNNEILRVSKVFDSEAKTTKFELNSDEDWINDEMLSDEGNCDQEYSKFFKTTLRNSTGNPSFKKMIYETKTNKKLKKSKIDSNIFEKMEKIISLDITVPEDIKIEPKTNKSIKQKLLTKKRSNQSERTKNYLCKLCNKILANKNTYKCHMERHTGCKYICEHCAKGFPTNAELNIHKVLVHGTGDYLKCRQCDFKAPRKFELMEHERMHTGERPFTCDKCGLTFRRRGIWKKHLIYHQEKTVQCNLCPRKFYLRSEMLAHSNNVHERIYMYLCPKCGATYAKTETIRRHLAEKHGVPKQMQGKLIRITKGKSDKIVE